MIRRISRNNDLKDLIKSCPSGVIDDIYAIEYYIQGYNTVIQANFTKKGDMLEVIIPSTDLETLPNGILMRRAYYKVLDASYPDGYYNLEFEDCMNIWLGENESEEPVIPEYVTEDELASTLSSYATQDWVSGQGYLTAETLPSDIATEAWVESQGYYIEDSEDPVVTDSVLADALSNISAPENCVEYDTDNRLHTELDLDVLKRDLYRSSTNPLVIGYYNRRSTFFATLQVEGETLRTVYYQEDPETGNLVEKNRDWPAMLNNERDVVWKYLNPGLNDDDPVKWCVEDFDPFLVGHDDGNGHFEGFGVGNPNGEGFRIGRYTREVYENEGVVDYVQNIDPFATESWVQSQGYLTSVPSGYATESWVESQGYLSATALSSALSGYATESYVDQAINDAVFGSDVPMPDLSSYATMSWVEEQGYYVDDSEDPVVTESVFVDGILNMYDWVRSQGYLTSVPSEYATQSWVSSNYLSATALSSALSGYATQSWVSSNYFEESKIWTGTQSEWNQLTSAQKALYTIALITQ